MMLMITNHTSVAIIAGYTGCGKEINLGDDNNDNMKKTYEKLMNMMVVMMMMITNHIKL